eukprot:CAMPEP_0116020570 /NCGR_PEP_ID=MMETSP0321-20121206/9874_1 /TAXON_ID=163516 /ORGANISM="Leptocylindrus danicus var. danicus, Strain B650" /LENGTH=187 /DNA_ID=CAMNT_0003491283 /DNA_START=42 /DNA_END=605 /DNA_ORIENTATION=+
MPSDEKDTSNNSHKQQFRRSYLKPVQSCCSCEQSQKKHQGLHPFYALQQLKQTDGTDENSSRRRERIDLLHQEIQNNDPLNLTIDGSGNEMDQLSIQQVRDKVCKRINEILLEMLPKSNDFVQQVFAISMMVDARLYKVAPSFYDYKNMDTLDARVKIMVRRIFCFRVKNHKTPVNDRYKKIAAAFC